MLHQELDLILSPNAPIAAHTRRRPCLKPLPGADLAQQYSFTVLLSFEALQKAKTKYLRLQCLMPEILIFQIYQKKLQVKNCL